MSNARSGQGLQGTGTKLSPFVPYLHPSLAVHLARTSALSATSASHAWALFAALALLLLAASVHAWQSQVLGFAQCLGLHPPFSSIPLLALYSLLLIPALGLALSFLASSLLSHYTPAPTTPPDAQRRESAPSPGGGGAQAAGAGAGAGAGAAPALHLSHHAPGAALTPQQQQLLGLCAQPPPPGEGQGSGLPLGKQRVSPGRSPSLAERAAAARVCLSTGAFSRQGLRQRAPLLTPSPAPPTLWGVLGGSKAGGTQQQAPWAQQQQQQQALSPGVPGGSPAHPPHPHSAGSAAAAAAAGAFFAASGPPPHQAPHSLPLHTPHWAQPGGSSQGLYAPASSPLPPRALFHQGSTSADRAPYPPSQLADSLAPGRPWVPQGDVSWSTPRQQPGSPYVSAAPSQMGSPASAPPAPYPSSPWGHVATPQSPLPEAYGPWSMERARRGPRSSPRGKRVVETVKDLEGLLLEVEEDARELFGGGGLGEEAPPHTPSSHPATFLLPPSPPATPFSPFSPTRYPHTPLPAQPLHSRDGPPYSGPPASGAWPWPQGRGSPPRAGWAGLPPWQSASTGVAAWGAAAADLPGYDPLPWEEGGEEAARQAQALQEPRVLPSPSQVYLDGRGRGSVDGMGQDGVLRVMQPWELREVLTRLCPCIHIEPLRDAVRQWFSDSLLRPLRHKIVSAPEQLMSATRALGLSLIVAPLVVPDLFQADVDAESPFKHSSAARGQGGAAGEEGSGAQETRKVVLEGVEEEEGECVKHLVWSLHTMLHLNQQQQQQQPQGMVFHLPQQQQRQQQEEVQKQLRAANAAALQHALDAALEFKQLREVLCGRWGNGLLATGSMPLYYAVKRIFELSKDTCVGEYNWQGGGTYTRTYLPPAPAAIIFSPSLRIAPSLLPSTVPLPTAPYTPQPFSLQAIPLSLIPTPAFLPAPDSLDSFHSEAARAWAPDLPTDAHLLAYLFCVHMAHPGWRLSRYLDASAGFSELYLQHGPLVVGAALPRNMAASEKFLGVVKGSQGVRKSVGDIWVVSRHLPAVFALFWNRRLQFCSQDRNALWDSVILLVKRIKQQHKAVFGAQAPGTRIGEGVFVSPLMGLAQTVDSLTK